MVLYRGFDLQGNWTQQTVVKNAINRTTFPWEALETKLLATKGKRYIPVDWADLSSYGMVAAEGHEAHTHDKEYDTLEYRNRVLGLAWYSGRITLDRSLTYNKNLAHEVFVSEGAHMVDFFFMTDAQRTTIYNAYHPDGTGTTPHGHDWFDAGAYRDFVGESFMGGFTKAYSDITPTITGWTHQSSEAVVGTIRSTLTADYTPPSGGGGGDYFSAYKYAAIFHQGHPRIRVGYRWRSREDAVKARRRPCAICKP